MILFYDTPEQDLGTPEMSPVSSEGNPPDLHLLLFDTTNKMVVPQLLSTTK